MKLLFITSIFIFFISCFTGNNEVNSNEVINNDEAETSNVDSLILKARELNLKKDYGKALVIFDQLIEFDSTRGEFYFKRASCKFRLKEYKGSKMDFLESVKLNYRTKDSYYNIGCIYAIQNIDSEALRYFELASDLDSTDLGVKIQINLIKEKIRKN